MDPLFALLAGVSGYLVGSISFARIVARLVAPGTDVTEYIEPIPNSDLVYEDDAASATLVNLNLGAHYGCLTSILDMLKVLLPMLALRYWSPETRYDLVFAALALVGHNWPLYHRFHGGRGESVIYGSMLVIDPLGVVVCHLLAAVLGVAIGQIHLVRWGGMVLLIPWLWLRTGDPAILAYILVANALFWISMRNDVKQYYQFHKKGVFRNQEELSDFMDMSRGLGRFMDRYSLPALLKRWSH
ncbi:MAG: glycerol-3-phosphate acyltransferase [Anaerolineae bacterium]|jgi:glycerol-3-phosphate acyltransferase PlsY